MAIGVEPEIPWRATVDPVVDLRAEDTEDPGREVFVDLDALDLPGQRGGVWIRYDFDEVTRPLTPKELASEPEISLAVRLVVSEVGADRLIVNTFGVAEAIGILYTVDNRLDPTVFNVVDEPTAPTFPGCGVAGSFAACANAGQYLGMGTWRALTPQLRYDADVLEAAVDLAVVAWWLQEQGLVDDFTEGATNYVHRCGGAAYGLPTMRCDAHIGNPARDDVAGADPHTGPIVFRAPATWNPRRGVYEIAESRRLDYRPWFVVEEWGADGDGLADAGDSDDLAPDVIRIDRAVGDDPIAAAGDVARVVAGLGPAAGPDLLTRLAR